MKERRIVTLIMALVMATSLAGCGNQSAGVNSQASTQAEVPITEAGKDGAGAAVADIPQGESRSEVTSEGDLGDVWALIDQQDIDFKIGLMSSSVNQSEESYRSAVRIQQKYGEEKILLDTFPANAVAEQETTISKVMAMASDPAVKAIVFNQASDGTIASIKKLKEVRSDILTVACNPNEDYDEIATVADVVLCKEQQGFAKQVAGLAVDMGAVNFVHYSFPRHMSNQNIAKRCETMREICEANGINFYEVTSPDPQGDSGTAGTQQFILEDVPRQIQALGEDTVFFSTNLAMHEPIIKTVMEGHAMYCGQSDPSPFDAFPAAMNIEVPEDKMGDTNYILDAIQRKVDDANMNGRISTWPTSLNMSYIQAGTMYAMLYCSGVVTETKGDEALEALISCYKTLFGDGVEIRYWTNNDGKQYDYVFSVLGAQYVFE